MVKKETKSPTLKTIIMVENTLRKMNESAISVAQLKRKLPKQVNHNNLKPILLYLEESNKIAVSMKGITWIHNPSKKMQDALKKGYEYS